jgi:hypothetical protein
MWCTVIASSLSQGTARGDCPSADTILATLDGLDLTAAARTRAFQLPLPRSLYERAAAQPGKVEVQRNGKLGQGVLVAGQPIETLWMALNDEDHYAGDGYLPVQHSEVIGGTPRGTDRVLFQYFKKAGVGRWWIDQVAMSNELFAESGSMLWELRWWDLMATQTEETLPPELARSLLDLGLSPIRESRGAWLMVPVAADCTLIEYVTFSDPGGVLSLAQWLGSSRVIRDTLQGIEKLAREHLSEAHSGTSFVQPDGTPIPISAGD